MIELRQFLMWILRKIAKWPSRWYNRLLEYYEYSDVFLPIIGNVLIVGGVGIALGLLASIANGQVGAVICIGVWGIGLGFIISSAVHTLYRAFKREQQEFINTLKQ